jgi:hypothetical protein
VRRLSFVAPLIFAAWLVGVSAAQTTSDLASAFRTPPDTAKPWVYWWWLNGNVTKAGITKDLEEMKRQGINGVLIFHSGGGKTPTGPRFLSPAWHDLFRYTLGEASRLRMEVSLNLCDGWDSGGPWITPDQANKKLVYSESQVDGRRKFSATLPVPPVVDGYYRDFAVVAFPERRDHPVTPNNVTAGSTAEGYVGELNFVPRDAVDGDPLTCWASKGKPGQREWLTFEYHEPLAATGIYVLPSGDTRPGACELQSSDDGTTFTTVTRFDVEPGKAWRAEFPQVRAKHFRLLFAPGTGDAIRIAEAQLLRSGDEPRLRKGIKWWPFKSGNRSFWDYPKQGPAALSEEYGEDGESDCRPEQIVDLTRRMDGSGRLDWEVPQGRWTILRFGYTLGGQRSQNQSLGSPRGYEADMLNSAGIESHFRHTAEPVIADAEATGVKVLKYLHIDSYELGVGVKGQQPTWSPVFRDEFRARRGYDLLPYLPALARRIVGNRETTDRFLTDIRWTIGDLMAERFWGRFRELAHARGVGIHTETGYGTAPWPHIDALRCAGNNDVTMGEFWFGTDIMSQFNHFGNVIRSVASAAHVYGRRIVQAEAFTAWTHWQESPYALKPVGDEAFTDGLNRMVFHQYTHQPEIDMKPGWQYSAGTHFDRNVTWWEQSRNFFEYLGRCQHLLQQGLFVADVAYFYGEGVTKFVPSKEYLRPALAAGYNFDSINADVLLHGASVHDHRLVLPDGMSYRVLVLPEDATISPEVLGKLQELVAGGVVVVGPKARRAPGLRYSDEEVRKLAGPLWDAGRENHVREQTLGEVLRSEGIPPDFEYRGDGGASLNFIHRSTDGAEIYFVANRKERQEQLECTFRVSGRQPELWDPVTGQMRPAPAFQQMSGRTSMPLEFAPYGSMFVVFRAPIDANATGTASRNFPVFSSPHELAGPWQVRFDPRWGGPADATFETLVSWTSRPEAGIRYYSGTATYRKTFDVPEQLRGPGLRLALDLGEVRNVAQVRLNGKDLGVLWTKPFRAEITGPVRPTGNVLEIDVVNLWPNRLIGDATLPPEERLAKTNITYQKDSPLLDSGLLGRVNLLVVGDRP